MQYFVFDNDLSEAKLSFDLKTSYCVIWKDGPFLILRLLR